MAQIWGPGLGVAFWAPPPRLVKAGEHLSPGSTAGESGKATVLGPRASAPLWHRLSRGSSVGMMVVRKWTVCKKMCKDVKHPFTVMHTPLE